ncbi:MAG: hypothetical protein F9K25_19145 [Candidatus Contendobacter sp.]|nr:MAG: hypothetical protein F9K25_19145 [Candidatus Contendobacter sp.]
MSTIHTTFPLPNSGRTRRLLIKPWDAFSSMNTLALLVGMIDPITHQVPTDIAGLKIVASQLDKAMADYLSGLQGIGALLRAAHPEGMTEQGLYTVGRLTDNLTAQVSEISSYRDLIALDPRFPSCGYTR